MVAAVTGAGAVVMVLGAVVVVGARVGAEIACAGALEVVLIAVVAVVVYVVAGAAPWVRCCSTSLWNLRLCEVRALLNAML